ncbi:DNA polymerase I [Rickettsiales bacterium Ac37b]|nr:DNA polymerase I [Rickettsiales bacterium Ac37b]
MSSNKHIILVDGYNFIFRAYHALPPLTRPNGLAVGAVYGFTSMMLKLLADHPEHYVAVIFDSGVKSFRNDIYPEYKANRPPAPEDLKHQFQLIREVTSTLNLPTIEKPGYEADDIIATFAHMAQNSQEKVIIVSSDKDLMQLIGHNIEMLDPIKSKPINAETVKEKYGVMPNKLLDFFSLIGDSSDNIPGVKGIGPKTASELINQYDNLEQLFNNIEHITPERRKNLLTEGKELAFLSKALLKLKNDVNLNIALEELKVTNINYDKFFIFLENYGFKSLITRAEQIFNLKKHSEHSEPITNIIHITESNKIKELINLAYNHGYIGLYPYFNTKTNLIEKLEFYLVNRVYYINITSEKKDIQTSFLDHNTSLNSTTFTLIECLALLHDLFHNPHILKIGYDIKSFLLKCYMELGCNDNHLDISPIEDVMLLSYVVNNGLCNHTLPAIAELYQQEDPNCLNAELIVKLYKLLKLRLNEDHLITLYQTIEKPLIYTLAYMEKAGVTIDGLKLRSLSKEFSYKLGLLEEQIYKEAGTSFNIASPKQLSEILFDKLALNKGKKSNKAIHYKTDMSVLEDLHEQGHNIAGLVLQWRQLSKLQNTYTDALPKQINSITGRVHTHYSMALTSTGRLSSSSPNLQNIPIRSEEGHKIRESFVARPGFKLLSADYSQIELRLLAHVANIPSLKQAFYENKDIHATTASQIFQVPLREVDSNLRRKAKAINFGIIYGITGFGLAKRLDISTSEANKYIELYFKEYPGIELYIHDTKEFVRKNGYVQTLFGRKCYITNINDKNANIRSFAERAAINAPLQGTAADIIKKSMIKLHNILLLKKLRTIMTLQVHDELIFEVPEDELNNISDIIKYTMENIITLNVPLIVDIGIGNNWSLIH